MLKFEDALTKILDSIAVMVDNDALLYAAETDEGFSLYFNESDSEVYFTPEMNPQVQETDHGFIFIGDDEQKYLIERLIKG
jgi:hypothetical protein